MINSENGFELTLAQTLQIELIKRCVKDRVEAILNGRNEARREELISLLCEDVANMVKLDIMKANYFKKTLNSKQ